jgi:putative transposase
MDTPLAPNYRGYRFPREIIAHCVWLYFRFSLSFRDIQEMMLERGVEVSHEAIRLWCLKFGAEYARRLRRRRSRFGDTWHLDEVFCKINGNLVYLWRAVDQSGEVLDILVQKRRDTKAAKRFLRKLLKGLRYVPRAIVTDKLPSYGAAKKDVMPDIAHHRGRRMNNRAENSHQPTRERERAMRCFKSMRHAQRFLAVHAQISNHFRPGRHLLRACTYRTLMTRRFASWSAITGAHNSVAIPS